MTVERRPSLQLSLPSTSEPASEHPCKKQGDGAIPTNSSLQNRKGQSPSVPITAQTLQLEHCAEPVGAGHRVYPAEMQGLPEKTPRAALINSLHVSPYSFLSPLPSGCPDSHKHMLQLLTHCIPCAVNGSWCKSPNTHIIPMQTCCWEGPGSSSPQAPAADTTPGSPAESALLTAETSPMDTRNCSMALTAPQTHPDASFPSHHVSHPGSASVPPQRQLLHHSCDCIEPKIQRQGDPQAIQTLQVCTSKLFEPWRSVLKVKPRLAPSQSLTPFAIQTCSSHTPLNETPWD